MRRVIPITMTTTKQKLHTNINFYNNNNIVFMNIAILKSTGLTL